MKRIALAVLLLPVGVALAQDAPPNALGAPQGAPGGAAAPTPPPVDPRLAPALLEAARASLHLREEQLRLAVEDWERERAALTRRIEDLLGKCGERCAETNLSEKPR